MRNCNAFISMLVEENPNQIVSVYDCRNNLIYHGKCDYAPLNLYHGITEVHEITGINIDGEFYTDIAIFLK